MANQEKDGILPGRQIEKGSIPEDRLCEEVQQKLNREPTIGNNSVTEEKLSEQVREKLNKEIEIVQLIGSSSTSVMSQNAVRKVLPGVFAGKINISPTNLDTASIYLEVVNLYLYIRFINPSAQNLCVSLVKPNSSIIWDYSSYFSTIYNDSAISYVNDSFSIRDAFDAENGVSVNINSKKVEILMSVESTDFQNQLFMYRVTFIQSPQAASLNQGYLMVEALNNGTSSGIISTRYSRTFSRQVNEQTSKRADK